MFDVDCAVIGAGVVGLAIARRLAKNGHEVLVLEAEGAIGSGISSRNSEVIHAGLYYPTASRKAQYCVDGRDLLYAYLEAHGVAHARYGKLIVATEESELSALDRIAEQAMANGVDDLQPLTVDQIRQCEPEVVAVGALLSPSTGVVDSHGLMLALLGELGDHGGQVAYHAPMLSGTALGNSTIRINVGGAEPVELQCRVVVNAAGLGASTVARAIEGVDHRGVPVTRFAKGCYFRLVGRSPFRRLIYPVPVPGGLGTHVTLDLGGQARFGPDVEWVTQPSYDVDPARAASFYTSIRRYWPGLEDGALAPDYAGVRPKIVGPGEPAGDFVIAGPEEHGVGGLINLFGIESPGLTSALAIANAVAQIVEDLSS